METTIAWIKDEDIKAVRGEDGVERLMVDGVEIPLGPESVHPTQQVIGYAQGGKRTRKQLRAHWANIAAGRFGLGREG